MKTQDLHTLVQTVELGSISKAAASMNLSHSAASQRLKHLEERCGTSLLNRQLTPIQPTAMGELVLEHGRRVLEMEAQLLSRLQCSGNDALRLCCTPAFGASYFPIALSEFNREYHHSVEFDYLASDQVVTALNEGRYDIAITEHIKPISTSTCWRHPLPPDKVIFVAAPSLLSSIDYQSLNALLAYPLYVAKPGCCSRELLMHNLSRRGMELESFKFQVSCGDLHVMVDALLSGEGVGFISSALIRPHLRSGALMAFELDGFEHLCHRSLLASWDSQSQPWFRPLVSSIEQAFIQ
ncbi:MULTISPECIES: LysR family transcriptional regulator [Ferrimonas]|uniref:LysR family transcriptional regulator n=1 Tax=Ferrimonas TaxID=44011 RepID=UPI00041AE79B|nr:MULTISPECIES: LysR family transcriptional regulator [Ferrimonas]USD36725.1 LysR family transcriptional regulator [Ferrimonas sp. SCSIO 43195]